jgi:hypothetical protein
MGSRLKGRSQEVFVTCATPCLDMAECFVLG